MMIYITISPAMQWWSVHGVFLLLIQWLLGPPWTGLSSGFFKMKEHYNRIHAASIKNNVHFHSSSTAYSNTIPNPSCIYRQTQNLSITLTLGWKYFVQGDQNLYVWTGLPWWDSASFVHKSTWQQDAFTVNYSLSPSRRFCFDWCMSGCRSFCMIIHRHDNKGAIGPWWSFVGSECM